MIENVNFENSKAIVTYKFSDNDMTVLKHLKEHGYMEFRNGKNSDIVDNLYSFGFVKSEDDAWHYTVELTELGKKVVNKML